MTNSQVPAVETEPETNITCW